MATNFDIFRTAAVVIRKHGEDATAEAAMRVSEMLEHAYLLLQGRRT